VKEIQENKRQVYGMEQERLHIHDSGDTTRLGMGRSETEDNKNREILDTKLYYIKIRVR